MASFDVSKEWIILTPPDSPHVKKAVEDLSRCIGLLAGGNRAPKFYAATDVSNPSASEAVIVLDNNEGGPERNGFIWRAGNERVEIFGESGRGLCNGIYSFLAALGINWPLPGQEKLPASTSTCFTLARSSACESSRFEANNPAAAPWRRFVPAGKKEIQEALEKSEAFSSWAGRNRYDALVFPLETFASEKFRRKLLHLKQFAREYGIALEAGGWDLSALVPRRYFLFQRDSFRMEGGKRKKEHHFCPTSPNAIRLIGDAGKKLFEAAEEIEVFHLWPDKEEDAGWCYCPACRAFTPQEQGRIAVNAAADVLAAVNPKASITYFEKPGEATKIPLRKNIFIIEAFPEEKSF
jgi:hypothetical protein